MIKLDYRTENPRWGLKGVLFSDWINYSFTLGFLSNINHYDNAPGPQSNNAVVSLHIEGNDEQGAWNKEGRIHYYGSEISLQRILPDLYTSSSAGNGRITKRINSNGYIMSLIQDFSFDIVRYMGYTTADVFPGNPSDIKRKLENYLLQRRFSTRDIYDNLHAFDNGFNV